MTTQELRFVDIEHLQFLTAYLKHALYSPQFGSLKKLYDIGTVLYVDGEMGVVVGYCGVGYEYVLFQKDGKDGYSVRGVEKQSKVRVKKIEPFDVLPLLVMMNDYLLRNKFKLCTAHQKLCYQHWQRTGKYEFVRPIGDNDLERIKLEKELEAKTKELESIKNKLKEL